MPDLVLVQIQQIPVFHPSSPVIQQRRWKSVVRQEICIRLGRRMIKLEHFWHYLPIKLFSHILYEFFLLSSMIHRLWKCYEQFLWKYTCHGSPPMINISILSVQIQASSIWMLPTHGGTESVKLPTIPPSGIYSFVTTKGSARNKPMMIKLNWTFHDMISILSLIMGGLGSTIV